MLTRDSTTPVSSQTLNFRQILTGAPDHVETLPRRRHGSEPVKRCFNASSVASIATPSLTADLSTRGTNILAEFERAEAIPQNPATLGGFSELNKPVVPQTGTKHTTGRERLGPWQEKLKGLPLSELSLWVRYANERLK
jgi:hypothetical protein